jgi:hypothetical protein
MVRALCLHGLDQLHLKFYRPLIQFGLDYHFKGTIMLKKMAEEAKEMKALITLGTTFVVVVLWMLSNFASAADFKQHVMDSKLDEYQERKFEVVKFIAGCSRQIEEYGNLTIIETEACETAEQEYITIKAKLCLGWGLNCPTE